MKKGPGIDDINFGETDSDGIFVLIDDKLFSLSETTEEDAVESVRTSTLKKEELDRFLTLIGGNLNNVDTSKDVENVVYGDDDGMDSTFPNIKRRLGILRENGINMSKLYMGDYTEEIDMQTLYIKDELYEKEETITYKPENVTWKALFGLMPKPDGSFEILLIAKWRQF